MVDRFAVWTIKTDMTAEINITLANYTDLPVWLSLIVEL